MQGESGKTNVLLRFIGKEKQQELDTFVLEMSARIFYDLTKANYIKSILEDTTIQFLSSLTPNDVIQVRSYTGYQFKNINAICRKSWNYQENGPLTTEIQEKYQLLSK